MKELAWQTRDQHEKGRGSASCIYNPMHAQEQTFGSNIFQSKVIFEKYVESTNEPINFAFCSLDLEHEDSWIIDSGATNHITGSLLVFNTLEPKSISNAIQTTLGHVLSMEGTGIVNLSTDREKNMSNVFDVPSLTISLMSIGYWTYKGFIMIFDSFQCLIFKYRTTKVVECRI